MNIENEEILNEEPAAETFPEIASVPSGTITAKPGKVIKRIMTISIGLLASIAIGVGIGFGAARFLKHDIVDYANDASAYKDDISVTMKNYERLKNSGGNYSGMKAYDLINVSYNLYSQQEKSSSIGVGVSLAVMNTRQVIQSRTAREGDRYFEESNSYSNFVSIYDRMYQEGGTTTTYWGGNKNYPGHAAKAYSNEEYAEMMGRQVSEGLIYVVSSKTVIEGDSTPSGDAPTSVKKTADGYVAEIELKRSSAVINYVKQMQTISNLASKPVFDYVHLTVYTDASLMLKKMVTHEKYTAVMAGFSSPCEGTLTTVYQIGADAEGIPEIGDTTTYPENL